MICIRLESRGLEIGFISVFSPRFSLTLSFTTILYRTATFGSSGRMTPAVSLQFLVKQPQALIVQEILNIQWEKNQK